MKLIFNPARFALLIAVALVVFGSCNKETSADTTEEELASQASSEGDAEADDIFNEVFDNVMGVNADVAFGGTGVFGKMSPGGSNDVARPTACPNLLIAQLNSPNTFPVKVVMDFGTGCAGRDGRTRSGKIIVTYTNRLIHPGAKATTTFENFAIDSIKIQGSHTITNQTDVISPSCLTHKWKVEVEKGKLTKPNGNYVEWTGTRTIAQIEGMCTPFITLDDIYKITGSASGKVKRVDYLIAWNSEITEPLVKKFTCRWLVRGIIKIARLNLTSNSPWIATINYGNGDCDNRALATINGVPHIITLP